MLRSGADWKVFEYALDRFPSLRRITISTKAHGKLFMPRYETPLIRSFPYGSVYALPSPWPFPDAHQTSRIMWKDKDTESSNEYTIFRRGLCSALRILAKHGKHRVSEFVVEDYDYLEDWQPWLSSDRRIPSIEPGWTIEVTHSMTSVHSYRDLASEDCVYTKNIAGNLSKHWKRPKAYGAFVCTAMRKPIGKCLL